MDAGDVIWVKCLMACAFICRVLDLWSIVDMVAVLVAWGAGARGDLFFSFSSIYVTVVRTSLRAHCFTQLQHPNTDCCVISMQVVGTLQIFCEEGVNIFPCHVAVAAGASCCRIIVEVIEAVFTALVRREKQLMNGLQLHPPASAHSLFEGSLDNTLPRGREFHRSE